MGMLMNTTEVELDTANYRRRVVEPQLSAMGTPSEFYGDIPHTITIKTRETEFGSIVEPIKMYKHYPHGLPVNGFGYQHVLNVPRVSDIQIPTTSAVVPSPVKKKPLDCGKLSRTPPKKKWIKDYMEEEPKSPVSVRVVTGMAVTPRNNSVVRPTTSPSPAVPVLSPCPTAAEPTSAAGPPPPALHTATILDFAQEHSRPRTTSNSNNGSPQIPSPPSAGSSGSSNSVGSTPRAGIREVHNKLEKNRRAHLKECFELLKRQLPVTSDEKKTSNLSILGSAIRYIQVLRRKERECEHEMERLAREKIAAQQRLAALKREVSVRATMRPRSIDTLTEEKVGEPINGQVIGIPISITSSPPHSANQMEASPPRTLNLSTKLRTLPIQITPTTSQVVRTSYGGRHNTLTLTTLAPAESTAQHNGPLENGISNALSTTIVHPAQIHLPLSQVVGNGGLVVAPAALQLLSASGGLRVLHTNGETNRIHKENGIVSPTTVSTDGSVVVSGLTPLVVSQPTNHLLQTHTLTTHKMVETQMMKGTPLTVSAQYLSATTIVKPVVVVSTSSAHTHPAQPPT